MLGRAFAPEMHAKGAETGYLFKFIAHFSSKQFFQADSFVEIFNACKHLVEYMNVLKTPPGRTIPPHTHQQLLTLCVKHLRAYDRAGGMFTPKHLSLYTSRHTCFFL
eukprot:4994788-Pyramimonas_sp.AAC.1